MAWCELWRLTKKLGSQDGSIRAAAIESLGRLNNPRAINVLFRAQRKHHDLSEQVAKAIEVSLATLGANAVPPILGLLEQDIAKNDWSCSSYPVDALGTLRDRRAVPLLIKILGIHRLNAVGTQKHAAIALGKIGDASALPALQRTRDLPVVVWEAAKEAIQSIEGQAKAASAG